MSGTKFNESRVDMAIVQSHLSIFDKDRSRCLKALYAMKLAEEMYVLLEGLRERIGLLDDEALGFVTDTPDRQGWFVQDEILHNIDKLLTKARGEL